MPPLRRRTIWPTPEEEEAINRGITLDPDAQPWTAEQWAWSRSAIEVVQDIVKAYRAGTLTLPPRVRKEHAAKHRSNWPQIFNADGKVRKDVAQGKQERGVRHKAERRVDGHLSNSAVILHSSILNRVNKHTD